jgi:CRISPR-associated protein Cas5
MYNATTENQKEIDISPLFQIPKLAVNAQLLIEPLAPLSMVVSMPGSYYRSQSEPSKFMIYGMIENLLGWHFSFEDRKAITKAIQKRLKKESSDLKFDTSEVGYYPLIQNHLRIDTLLLKPHAMAFEDLWTQHLKGGDERHLKGVRNYDWRLAAALNKLENSPEARNRFFEDYGGLFPVYYQSPKKREFVLVQGKYGYKVSVHPALADLIVDALNRMQQPLYLGTNEGWVDVKMNIL